MRLPGLTRQVYVDLVRARSRVRIVSAEAPPSGPPPIFVLGVYRSGTTLLRYVLDSHPHIACPPETNFLHRLGSTLDDPDALHGLASMGFDRAHVVARLRELAEYFYRNYAFACDKPRWADKTPLYIDHLATLAEMFPAAQYVVIHRHPLDQIHSHTKGGTFVHAPVAALYATYGDVRVAAAHYWVDQTRKIRGFTTSHPPAAVLTYEELCARPEVTMRRVLEALGEPWSSEVLDFQAHRHDQGREAASIQRTSGFSLQSGGYLGWDPDLLVTCRDIVAETAAELGYRVGP